LVTLIESDNRVGGRLKSEFFNNRYFDYGTHLMSETNIEELDKFLFGKLNDSKCVITNKVDTANYFNGAMNTKNSYVETKYLDKEVFKKGCKELLGLDNHPEEIDLKTNLLSKFGPTFYKSIFEPLIQKYIGVDPKVLAAQVGHFFDMSRLIAFNEKTTIKLCKLDVYNNKLGHHVRTEEVIKYYPNQGGIGAIVELLIQELKAQNITIKLDTNIKEIIQIDGNVNVIKTDQEAIKVDRLIWTLPTSYLINLSRINKKTSPPEFRNTGLYDFTFRNPLNLKSAYINIYDLNMYSARVTLYQNLSKNNNYSCTVEVLVDSSVELDGLVDNIELELYEMGLVDKSNECMFKQFRPIENGFSMLTNEFLKGQKELNQYCESRPLHETQQNN